MISPQVVLAQDNQTVLSSDDRNQTIQALKLIKKGKWTSAEQMIADTRNPLSAKIYYWLAYTKNHGDINFTRIAHFTNQNPDWPLQKTLRLNAEKNLNDSIKDEAITAWFKDRAPLTPDGMERYLDALINQNKNKQVNEIAASWWSNALLTPSQQSRFLKKYKNYIDERTHLIRFNYLIFKEHYTNARAIAKVIGRGYPALADARIAVAKNSPGVDAKIASVPPHLQGDPGLAYERLRWRRRNDKTIGALEILHNPPAAELIANPEAWWKERHIMARRMIEDKKYDSAYLLVSKHQQEEGLSFAQAEFLAGWLALRFLDKPWRAFEHFEALYHRVSSPISRARGAYWAGRASEDLGHPGIARQWYRVAARHQTTFYGQMAMAALSDEYKPPQQVQPRRILQKQNRFNRSEMVQVARILNKAGYRRETTAFLDALANKLEDPDDYILVADLAVELDHYHNAVRIAKKGLKKNIFMMEHAYPTLLSRVKNIELEWALVHSIIRQESAFDFDAKSPAGARGLMQLMPATAKEVARKKGISHKTSWLTSKPDHNILLGSTYMQQMLDRFDGSYILAAAAYNAGPGRVGRWLDEIGDPRSGEIDIIDWAEMIPIYETRNYVQRVLEGVYVYRMKLRDLQQKDLAPIHVVYDGSKSKS